MLDVEDVNLNFTFVSHPEEAEQGRGRGKLGSYTGIPQETLKRMHYTASASRKVRQWGQSCLIYGLRQLVDRHEVGQILSRGNHCSGVAIVSFTKGVMRYRICCSRSILELYEYQVRQ